MAVPATRTGDGLDRQTATNYIGPFLLTTMLLDHITDRVVHVTSQPHRQGKIDLADVDWRTRKYNAMAAYRASKLGVVLFSLELQSRLTADGSPVRSVLASPGIARTGLAAHSRANLVNRFTFLTNSPERGALSVLYAATQDVPANAYVGPDGPGGLRGYPAVGRSRRGAGRTAVERDRRTSRGSGSMSCRGPNQAFGAQAGSCSPAARTGHDWISASCQ